MSKGTVERALRIGKRILPELQDELQGTPIARREGDLYRLAGLSEARQQRVLQRLREADEPPERLSALLQKETPAAPARPPTRGQLFARLEAAWHPIPKHEQVLALELLSLLIDRHQRRQLIEALRARPGAGAASPEEERT